MAALLALAASLSWGFGDFLGGVKARVLPSLTVLAAAQARTAAEQRYFAALHGGATTVELLDLDASLVARADQP